MTTPSDIDLPSSYVSELSSGSDRFLSRLLEHSLAASWQTATDFVERFPPTTLMRSLAQVDDLRARLLVRLANVHERIAAKKSVESASEDLTLVLDEQIATPEQVLEEYGADDRVRYLPGAELWDFAFEDRFFTTQASDGAVAHERAVRRMTFLVESALEERLLTLGDLFDGIGFELLADCLPPASLRLVLVDALRAGREGRAVDEPRMLNVVPMLQLLGFVPLEVVWSNVILARVATRWVTPPPTKTAEVLPPPAPVPSSSPGAGAVNSAAPSLASASAASPSVASASAAVEGDAAGPRLVDPPPAGSDEARGRVTQKLRDISRLPPRHEELPTALLMSIESMYSDLAHTTNDDDRAEVMRESFPNELQLRTAMLALAELLEPSIDVTRPPVSGADADSLIKLVVFEERKRREGGSSATRSSVRPPPLPGLVGRSATSIPAAARISGPPPALPKSHTK